VSINLLPLENIQIFEYKFRLNILFVYFKLISMIEPKAIFLLKIIIYFNLINKPHTAQNIAVILQQYCNVAAMLQQY